MHIAVDGSTRSGERARERAKTTTKYSRRIENLPYGPILTSGTATEWYRTN